MKEETTDEKKIVSIAITSILVLDVCNESSHMFVILNPDNDWSFKGTLPHMKKNINLI